MLHGEIPANATDLPSAGVWIEEDAMIEEPVSVADNIVRMGLAEAVAQGIAVPDRVRELAAAYHEAATAAL